MVLDHGRCNGQKCHAYNIHEGYQPTHVSSCTLRETRELARQIAHLKSSVVPYHPPSKSCALISPDMSTIIKTLESGSIPLLSVDISQPQLSVEVIPYNGVEALSYIAISHVYVRPPFSAHLALKQLPNHVQAASLTDWETCQRTRHMSVG